jgi:hypothetical protein
MPIASTPLVIIIIIIIIIFINRHPPPSPIYFFLPADNLPLAYFFFTGRQLPNLDWMSNQLKTIFFVKLMQACIKISCSCLYMYNTSILSENKTFFLLLYIFNDPYFSKRAEKDTLFTVPQGPCLGIKNILFPVF